MKEFRIKMHQKNVIQENIHACIGYFDGIHQGHQVLMQKAIAKASQNNELSAVITFHPDPWQIIKNMQNIEHLTSMHQRKNIAEKLGIDIWLILEFDFEMANLTVEEFHEKILNRLPIKTLICGFDFHYGRKGQGDCNTLQKLSNFPVEIVEKIDYHKKKISSTYIEECIKKGDLEQANLLLTRAYQMDGIVVKGKQNGRKIGFPTANLQLITPYVLPKAGVYVGVVLLQAKKYPAMINIGYNPTIADDNTKTIEAHILDEDMDLYGQKVSFCFYQFIREEVKFNSLEELAKQLKKDREFCKIWFQKQRMEKKCD